MSPKKAWTVALAVALVLAVGGAIWSGAFDRSKSTESGSLRIGAIDPLTGPFAAYGEPVRDGMLMAVDEVNAIGGIGGRKLELILEDDGGDPKLAVNAFTKLATISKVPVTIGPLSSGASMATAPLADRYRVVQLSTLAGTIDLTHAGEIGRAHV